MVNEKLEELKNNLENYSREDLDNILVDLYNDFENTKNLILNLNQNLNEIEDVYNRVLNKVQKYDNSGN
mgnify:CR=1 FL=1|jgi:hypothetical protein